MDDQTIEPEVAAQPSGVETTEASPAEPGGTAVEKLRRPHPESVGAEARSDLLAGTDSASRPVRPGAGAGSDVFAVPENTGGGGGVQTCPEFPAREDREERREGETMTLKDLRPGERATIVGWTSSHPRSRLLEMGVLPGTLVELVRYAPLGDPIDVKIRGYHLALRGHEAGEILVVLE